MNILDPNDLDCDGSTFSFPYVTIEHVLMLDANTLLVIDADDYPGVGGRNSRSARTKLMRIGLVPEPKSGLRLLGGFGALLATVRRRRPPVA